jgi:anion-transporting  ArsA/GET3 family ATPase
VLGHPLVFVTGKGGVGKTTVAAALGLAAAGRGHSVLVCEVAGAGHVARAFGRAGTPPAFRSASIEPEPALGEWLARHIGTAAAAVLRRSRAFEYFVAAAPGAAELVTIGQAVDFAVDPAHDCVIVDGPATGHALGMLAAPRTFAELAPVGPVAHEAAELRRRLTDPAFTAYVGVAAPEPMAVEELLESDRGLPRGFDLVVVNAVHADRFSDEDALRLEAAAERGPGRALLDAVLVEHRRARRESAQVQRLREHTRAPVIEVPFVFPRELQRSAA